MADSYVNTRTIMGDQEAFDALIAGELEDLVEDCVIRIYNSGGIKHNNTLKRVKLPNLIRAYNNAISYNNVLETIDIGKTCSISSTSFTSNPKLNAIILRGTEIASYTLSNNYFFFDGSKISFNQGGIYVPSDLVNAYRQDNIWSHFIDHIYSIADYPLNDFSTITDTWSEIFSNESNGTYSTKYSLGDTKKITINENDYYAQIVAFDSDELSDGSGNAKITWLIKGCYATKYSMNQPSTNVDGWPATSLRSWLINSIFPLFPSIIQSEIKEVKKYSYDMNISAEVMSNDKLWIPSVREIFNSGDFGKELNGPSYNSIFGYYWERIKHVGSSKVSWWLRSTCRAGSNSFYTINDRGEDKYTYASNSNIGVCIGFCT